MDIQAQITRNCHCISRFLTKPWELGEGRLRYYDFDLDVFDEHSSNNLFADEHLNSRKVEDWLYNVIETPLAAVRSRLVAADPTALGNWRFHRAAVLMLWLQGVRGRSVEADDSRIRLDTLATLPLGQIDDLVRLVMQDYALRLVFFTAWNEQRFYPPPQKKHIFVPSTGTFPFIVRDQGDVSPWTFGFGLPLDLECALVAVPVERHGTLDLSNLPDAVANYSIGPSTATRVVLPPQIAATDDELRAFLKDKRQVGDEQISAAREITARAERNG